MNEYEKIRQMYEQGFRCIRYDDTSDGDMNIYFKNFESEGSDTMKVRGIDEKLKVINFIKDNPIK